MRGFVQLCLGDSPIRPLLTMLDVDVTQLRSKLSEMLDRLPKVSGIGGDVQLSSSMGTLFNLCDKVAQKRQDSYISSEVFLLAALHQWPSYHCDKIERLVAREVSIMLMQREHLKQN